MISLDQNRLSPKTEADEEEEDVFEDAVEGSESGASNATKANQGSESESAFSPSTALSPSTQGYPTESESASESPTEDTSPRLPSKMSAKALIERNQQELDADLELALQALELFFANKHIEAERLMATKANESLYCALGASVLSMMRAILTFDKEDLKLSLLQLKRMVNLADVVRERTGGIVGLVKGVTSSRDYKNMSRLQKHAEIIFAEGFLLKAALSILTDSNLIVFVREGLNIRTAYNIYKSLHRCIENIVATEGRDALEKYSFDNHVIGGVRLGIGLFNLLLSMLPSRVLKVFEIIGFSGDRDLALRNLEAGGFWRSHPDDQRHNDNPLPQNRGIRSVLCNLVLIGYHSIMSSMVQLPDVDLEFSARLLNYELSLYPQSIIFLMLQARHTMSLNLEDGIKKYEEILVLDIEWTQLKHLVLWDTGMAYTLLQQHEKASSRFETLYNESSWSKAAFLYMTCVCKYEANGNTKEVTELMTQVAGLLRVIAGKHIPIEKFCSRKTRKFKLQDGRLLSPAIEYAYVFNMLEMAPTHALETLVKQTDEQLQNLERKAQKPINNINSSAELPYPTFMDDVCLALFLKGIALSQLTVSPSELKKPFSSLQPNVNHLTLTDAINTFTSIFNHANLINLDHYIIPYARFELGNLYQRLMWYDKAITQYEISAHGGYEKKSDKKKFSLETELHFKVHNALARARAGAERKS